MFLGPRIRGFRNAFASWNISSMTVSLFEMVRKLAYFYLAVLGFVVGYALSLSKGGTPLWS